MNIGGDYEIGRSVRPCVRVCVRRSVCVCTRWLSTCHKQLAGTVAPSCENFYIGGDMHSHEHLLVIIITTIYPATVKHRRRNCININVTTENTLARFSEKRSFCNGWLPSLQHLEVKTLNKQIGSINYIWSGIKDRIHLKWACFLPSVYLVLSQMTQKKQKNTKIKKHIPKSKQQNLSGDSELSLAISELANGAISKTGRRTRSTITNTRWLQQINHEQN